MQSPNTTNPAFKGIIAVAILFIAGSAIYYFVVSRPKSDTAMLKQKQLQTNAAADQALLAKKEGCAKYSDGIKKNATDSLASAGVLGVEYYVSVFYSPVKNSCLYAYWTFFAKQGSADTTTLLSVKDILTDQFIYSEHFSPALQGTDAVSRLEEQIQKLN